MATGFMPYFISVLLLVACATATAADIALIGVIGDKAAVLAIDGGDPKAVKVGQKWNGITVLSVEKERATIELEGKKRILQRGQHYRTGVVSSGQQSVTLAADAGGLFFTESMINGNPVRMMIDTGASAVTISAADAERMRIDYRNGRRQMMQTANGTVSGYVVRLANVRIGNIEVTDIDAIVVEKGLSTGGLLGMTFLNRVEMQRSGQTMVLIKRY